MSISFWYSVVLYTSQVLKVVKNAENDIFLLVSSNLMSIFSPNIGHQQTFISKSYTTIIQLNIFNESHPVDTFWFACKIGRPKSLLMHRAFFGSKISPDSLSCYAVIFTGLMRFLLVMSGSPKNFSED